MKSILRSLIVPALLCTPALPQDAPLPKVDYKQVVQMLADPAQHPEAKRIMALDPRIAVEVVERGLDHDAPEIRTVAAEWAHEVQDYSIQLCSSLKEALRIENDWPCAFRLAEALVSFTAPGIRALVETIPDQRVVIRLAAIRALGRYLATNQGYSHRDSMQLLPGVHKHAQGAKGPSAILAACLLCMGGDVSFWRKLEPQISPLLKIPNPPVQAALLEGLAWTPPPKHEWPKDIVGLALAKGGDRRVTLAAIRLLFRFPKQKLVGPEQALSALSRCGDQERALARAWGQHLAGTNLNKPATLAITKYLADPAGPARVILAWELLGGVPSPDNYWLGKTVAAMPKMTSGELALTTYALALWGKQFKGHLARAAKKSEPARAEIVRQGLVLAGYTESLCKLHQLYRVASQRLLRLTNPKAKSKRVVPGPSRTICVLPYRGLFLLEKYLQYLELNIQMYRLPTISYKKKSKKDLARQRKLLAAFKRCNKEVGQVKAAYLETLENIRANPLAKKVFPRLARDREYPADFYSLPQSPGYYIVPGERGE